MERIAPFDLVIFLGLLAMFVVGYAQGIIRRLLGIGAILFSIVLGAQLRQPLGQYLANEWTNIVPSYSYMVAFGAVFVASAVTISIGIQLSYRPAPLFPKYPVLDELLGGILGVLEGFIILIALLLILDPHYNQPAVQDAVGIGEFRVLRSLHGFLDTSVIADVLRHAVIPGILGVFGVLFPLDVRSTFAAVLLVRR